MQVVEALAAAQQFAHHQRRSSLAPHFGTSADGARLAVGVFHCIVSKT